METTENEAVMKLGRMTLERYEREARKEERLSQLKKSLPADQWKRLLALAQAYDKALEGYHHLESIDRPDQVAAYFIEHAAGLVDEASSALSQAGEDIDPHFDDDIESLLDLADEEAGLEWARAVVAEEQQAATA